MRRLLPGFVESLQLVEIPEMPEQKLQLIFQKFSDYARQNLKVNIAKSALELSIRLLKRFYPYESFPGKGIRFLSDLISEVGFQADEEPNVGRVPNPADVEASTRTPKSEIRNREVLQHFIRRTGLPEVFLRDDLALDQPALRRFFNQRIIGQEEAVAQLCDIVKVFKAGLNNPYKPITTLIFAGPTWVGKTASALALSQFFFGQGQRQSPLVRIDMSEFQHPAQLARFLGAGGEPGKLVADVRERPFSVLLLDEAEKADPSIFDAFLTVLDEGMLTDAYGRITNFRNCIIILTTNLGASNRRSIGYGSEAQGQSDEVYRSAIGKFFRPEFMNRMDGLVVFHSLSQEDIRLITLKELEDVKQREGFVKRGLEIHFTENVVSYLAGIGFHEKYGARPLQRALEDHVVKPLANWLLKSKVVEGAKLEVDFVAKLIVRVI
ncbi:MAG: AAA family ATPase, partial [Bacteroidota bacterium]